MTNASPVVREEAKQDGAPPRRDEPATRPRLQESIALLKRYAAAVADSLPEPGSDAAVGIERPLAEVRRMAQETAAAAESPGKILAHNLCCIIGALLEAGIEAIFWPEAKKEAGRAVMLPMKQKAGS